MHLAKLIKLHEEDLWTMSFLAAIRHQINLFPNLMKVNEKVFQRIFRLISLLADETFWPNDPPTSDILKRFGQHENSQSLIVIFPESCLNKTKIEFQCFNLGLKSLQLANSAHSHHIQNVRTFSMRVESGIMQNEITLSSVSQWIDFQIMHGGCCWETRGFYLLCKALS